MYQRTPLYVACKHNRADIVKLLLRRGAQVDATCHQGLKPSQVCMDVEVLMAIKRHLKRSRNK